jgi:hypothetical protein
MLTLWAIIRKPESFKGFVTIHSTKLLKYGGSEYLKYINWLIKEGFIEKRGPYIPKKQSWKYHILKGCDQTGAWISGVFR